MSILVNRFYAINASCDYTHEVTYVNEYRRITEYHAKNKTKYFRGIYAWLNVAALQVIFRQDDRGQDT